MKKGKEKKGLFAKVGKKKKIINWQRKEHKEKILIVFLISAIVAIALVLGYGIYDSFQTKAETETEMSSLSGAIVSLNEEKSQLVTERDALDQTVILLTQQKTQLSTEKSNLTSQLSTLQDDYDKLSVKLKNVEDDLDDCESSP